MVDLGIADHGVATALGGQGGRQPSQVGGADGSGRMIDLVSGELTPVSWRCSGGKSEIKVKGAATAKGPALLEIAR